MARNNSSSFRNAGRRKKEKWEERGKVSWKVGRRGMYGGKKFIIDACEVPRVQESHCSHCARHEDQNTR